MTQAVHIAYSLMHVEIHEVLVEVDLKFSNIKPLENNDSLRT